VGHVVKNPNYRGISASFWRSLARVGNADTLQVLGTPYCGKGEPSQVIRVGHASPACVFTGVDVFGGSLGGLRGQPMPRADGACRHAPTRDDDSRDQRGGRRTPRFPFQPRFDGNDGGAARRFPRPRTASARRRGRALYGFVRRGSPTSCG
jgi:hypothetical protein